MSTDEKIFNKKLANQIHQHIKWIIQHDKMEFISNARVIQHMKTNVIYYISTIKRKKNLN